MSDETKLTTAERDELERQGRGDALRLVARIRGWRVERARDKRGGGMLDGVRMRRPFLNIIPNADRRDCWFAGWDNSIRWAWIAPRWLSVCSWFGINDRRGEH